jgi:hypothetical protein
MRAKRRKKNEKVAIMKIKFCPIPAMRKLSIVEIIKRANFNRISMRFWHDAAKAKHVAENVETLA